MHLWTKWSLLKTVCVGAAFVVILTWIVLPVWRFRQFSYESQRVHALLTRIQSQPAPEGFDQERWNTLWGFNVSCASNILTPDGDVTLAEIINLRTEIENACRRPLTANSARQVNELFAHSGQHGRFYTMQHKRDFERLLTRQ